MARLLIGMQNSSYTTKKRLIRNVPVVSVKWQMPYLCPESHSWPHLPISSKSRCILISLAGPVRPTQIYWTQTMMNICWFNSGCSWFSGFPTLREDCYSHWATKDLYAASIYYTNDVWQGVQHCYIWPKKRYFGSQNIENKTA